MSIHLCPNQAAEITTFLLDGLVADDTVLVAAAEQVAAYEAKLAALREQRERKVAALRCLGYEPSVERAQ